LRRGFAICSRSADGEVLTKAAEVEIGEYVTIRLAEGKLTGEVFGRQDAPAPDERENAHVQ
jgi:exonuclease VII large subunit